MAKRRVALIGYGAIATEICAALADDAAVVPAQVLVRPERRTAVWDVLPHGVHAITAIEDLHADIDFVLECAGHEAVRTFGPQVLARGIDFGVTSVGALAQAETLDNLRTACAAGEARTIILPGAIGGIDALAAAGSDLTRVCYTARKPPIGWRGSPAEATHDLDRIGHATEIFNGNARDAALEYPKNANVVATVALAGIGFDRTEVTLVADPAATGNTHHITATGPRFELSYSTTGQALPTNPRTSALTALSAIRAIRHRGTGLLV